MQSQLPGEVGQPHGGQLGGFSGKERKLRLQNGIGATLQRTAPALQRVQDPSGLLDFIPEIGMRLGFVRFFGQPGIVTADGDTGEVILVDDGG